MKKSVYLIAIIGFLLMLVGCTNNDSYLKDISYSDLNKKLEAKEEFFFVVTQDGCSHCESFVPVLKSTLEKQKIVGYNFNLSTLSESDNEKFNEVFNIEGTPTTIFIKDGEEISLLQRIYGEATEEQILQKLKNNNYIK